MLSSRPLKLQSLLSWRVCIKRYHSRRPNPSDKIYRQQDKVKNALKPKSSLLEELFPDEVPSHEPEREIDNQDVPRLALPKIDKLLDEYQNDVAQDRERSKGVTNTAASSVFRQPQLAGLILHNASNSLDESDFRRIAPKGKHIKEWAGPGDILKGVPCEG